LIGECRKGRSLTFIFIFIFMFNRITDNGFSIPDPARCPDARSIEASVSSIAHRRILMRHASARWILLSSNSKKMRIAKRAKLAKTSFETARVDGEGGLGAFSQLKGDLRLAHPSHHDGCQAPSLEPSAGRSTIHCRPIVRPLLWEHENVVM
jgi:hypothetical protein